MSGLGLSPDKEIVVTQAHLKSPWGGRPNGEWFRCYLCGYKFVEGDVFAWHYGTGTWVDPVTNRTRGLPNFLSCADCRERFCTIGIHYAWVMLNKLIYTAGWWFVRDPDMMRASDTAPYRT